METVEDGIIVAKPRTVRRRKSTGERLSIDIQEEPTNKVDKVVVEITVPENKVVEKTSENKNKKKRKSEENTK